ncbi:phosphoribosylformylglycinamidine synthase subunit PurQ [Candidatus Marinimicrobia bacterium PRS2]|nr:phosphoribosylformylglycinamidine synthase subunit PurQ [Candidatus Marinimicrobia bacterium PRS2]
MMHFAVIVFPGSNCDHDAYHVFRHILDVPVDFVWHRETDLKKYDAIIIPGGFSYGDYLRTGAIARFSPVMESIIKEAHAGKPVFGICNGFQILIESGLLPGALIINQDVRFLSQDVTLEVDSTDSIYTRSLQKGRKLTMPIAHKQGNFIANDDTLKMLEVEDRIAFRYSKGKNGNPNGSINRIAGILNKKRNVLGMMPHPERAVETLLGSDDGIDIFKSMIGVA